MSILITFQQEKKYLEHVVTYIKNRKQTVLVALKEKQEQVMEDKKSIYNTVSTNDATELAFRRAENEKNIMQGENSQKELAKLTQIEDSPYFGCVVFCEDDDDFNDTIRIGFQGITTENYENLIYDWRTPIASLYYDYPVGKAAFTVPHINNTITGENKYKAQIIIKQQEVIKLLPALDILNEDALLYELSQTTSTKMKNIVSTIQKEQNDIIRYRERRDLIIQGVAGSGKTSVALHKIAYLLFQNRGQWNAQNFLLLAPSKEFAEYINNVLPEMGEEMVPVLQFDTIARENLSSAWQESIETKEEYIQNIGAKNYRQRHLPKTDLTMVKLIELFRQKIKEHNFRAADFHFKNHYFAKEMLLHLYRQRQDSTIKDQIALLTAALFSEIKQAVTQSRYRSLREELKQEVTQMFEYHTLSQLWQGFKLFAGKKGILFNSQQIEYADLFLVAALQLTFQQPKKYSDKIQYLIIDEMQDYSPIQYWYLKQIFPKEQKMILGDEHQRLLPGGSDTPQIQEIFPAAARMNLQTSYRSTKEIIHFANKFTTSALTPINRSGEPVKAIVQQELANYLHAKSDYSKVIIFPIALAKTAFLQQFSTAKNTKILNTADAKGLEFDLVFLYGFFDQASQPLVKENELYVAVTRATKELCIVDSNS